jgi:hypothetical protein
MKTNFDVIKSNAWIVLIFFISAAFCWKLIDYENLMATGLAADSPAHIWFNSQYCKMQYMWGNTHTTSIWYPFGIDLSIMYDQPLLNILTCPVLEKWGPMAQFNFMLFIQILLMFLCTYAFARKYIQLLSLRVLFVISFCFCSYAQNKLLGQPNLLSNIWAIPLVFLIFDQIDLKKTWLTIFKFILLAICLASAWQNSSLLFLIVVFFLAQYFYKNKFNKIAFRNLALASIVMIVFLYPLVLPMFLGRAKFNIELDPIENIKYFADVLSYFTPQFWHPIYPLYKSIVGSWEPFETGWAERAMSFDYVLFVLFIFALIYKKDEIMQKYKLWILLLVIYFLLSLGPILAVGNINILRLDYYYSLNTIIPFSLTRNPARYGIVVIFIANFFAFLFLQDWLNANKPRLVRTTTILLITISTIFFSNLWATSFQIPMLSYKKYFPWDGIEDAKQELKINPEIKAFTVPFLPLPSQFSSFFQSMTDMTMLNAYISYVALDQNFFDNIDKFHGELKVLRCDLPENEEAYLLDSIKNLDFLLDNLYKLNIRYILSFNKSANCEPLLKWKKAVKDNSRIQIFTSGIYEIYKIKSPTD